MLTRRLLLVPTVLLAVLGLAAPASATPDDWRWRELNPDQAPLPGGTGAIAFDESSGEIVLFANKVFGGFGNKTWTWDGDTWSEVTGPGPSVRDLMEMVYDPENDSIVLYGGLSGTEQTLGDTWIFEDGEWSEADPPVSPPPNYGQAMAYDPVLGQVLMFGGIGDNRDQTWAWDGNTWTELEPAHLPRGRFRGQLAYDAHRERLVLFGGSSVGPGPSYERTTYSWSGSDWVRERGVSRPPGRTGFAMTSADGVVTMFGGNNGKPERLGDTWVLGKHRWRELDIRSPGGRYQIGMAYDGARDEIIMFGGYKTVDDDWVALDETWALRR